MDHAANLRAFASTLESGEYPMDLEIRGLRAAADALEHLNFEAQRLKKAFNVIFPQPVKQPDGSEVDSSADENLDAAIIDLESHGRGDAVVIATMKRVLTQLVEARETVCD